jgi:hypothetical protein
LRNAIGAKWIIKLKNGLKNYLEIPGILVLLCWIHFDSDEILFDKGRFIWINFWNPIA